MVPVHRGGSYPTAKAKLTGNGRSPADRAFKAIAANAGTHRPWRMNIVEPPTVISFRDRRW